MRVIEAVESGDLNLVRATITAGEDVNWIDATGETNWASYDAVEVAARLGRADMVRELIGAGAKNRIFIDTAIGGRHLDVVRAWLDATGDERHTHLNCGGEDGMTTLMIAAHVGSAEIVRLLLDAGADPMVTAEDGRTALSVAEQEGNLEVAEVLRGAMMHRMGQ